VRDRSVIIHALSYEPPSFVFGPTTLGHYRTVNFCAIAEMYT
jgi:hypothetical protein